MGQHGFEMNKLRTHAMVLAVVMALTVSAPAAAYIDSGTGSLILQAALSGILGILFVARSFWANLIARRPKSRVASGTRKKEQQA